MDQQPGPSQSDMCTNQRIPSSCSRDPCPNPHPHPGPRHGAHLPRQIPSAHPCSPTSPDVEQASMGRGNGVGENMLGGNTGQHQTQAAGNLGSAALLLLLHLSADTAKMIFLGLILHPPPFPSWLSLAHGFVRKLAKSCSLSRKRAGMREKEIFDNLCFSMSLFGAAGSNLCPPLPGAQPDLAVSAGGSLAGAHWRKMERRGIFQRKPKQNRENPESCSLCHK